MTTKIGLVKAPAFPPPPVPPPEETEEAEVELPPPLQPTKPAREAPAVRDD